MMSKEVILTGLRANGELTLGNYLGALKPIVNLANSKADICQINLFMPDLHSIVTEVDYSELQNQIFHTLKQYVAAGLDLHNANIMVYRQSYISAHSELAWIFDCFTGFGEASRMVEFKDKSSQLGDDRVSVGLFNYPMLMAADILLYDAKWVPVGEDQRQHLELARTLAERFNNKFGKLFIVPEHSHKQVEFAGLTEPLRIRSLRNPEKKMSKSINDPAGTILLSDTPDSASKKIMSATTDSIGSINYDFSAQPGVSNLLQIDAYLSGQKLEDVINKWQGNTKYGDLKKSVADIVHNFLTDFQTKYDKVDKIQLVNKLQSSESAMAEVANAKLYKVQQAVGLR